MSGRAGGKVNVKIKWENRKTAKKNTSQAAHRKTNIEQIAFGG